MGKKWMSNWRVVFTAEARKFQVAAVGFIGVVVAALRDGHLSTGDKWEIAGAAAVALGVFAAPNKPAVRAHRRTALTHNPPQEG
jgi:hypothetical protein